MGEYEDRYPDAYGHAAETDPVPGERHFSGLGLPRQMRGEPIVPERRPPARRPFERRAFVARTPEQICDDVWVSLRESPFIDASGLTVAVTGSEVTLEGTIDSLIAISLARALIENTAGVSRVHLRLKVRPATLRV
jgi:hypothetical protein